MAFTYIVECSDGTLYTGWTTDLDNRIAKHNSGNGAKYTRGRGPVKLVYHEEFSDSKTARERECAIKKLPRIEKKQLISNFSNMTNKE
ncbi:GIY-YIG nuclease family protein [Dendrosporobacter sp. 1207_IL3150]|uniref:GIY-YIG nuclease family protein n=1 Tax=Dendrosporobacter sp. 1207_IL3150 TaxID=3084054 RepID=UPI002FDAFA31